MRKTKGEEWDWPQEARGPIVDAVPRRTGWASPTATKAVNGYLRFVILIWKLLAASVLTLIVLGCVWFIVTLLSLK